MGALRNNMIMTMKNHGYSDKTIKLYTSSIRSLATHFNKTPLDITKQQIEYYIYYLRKQNKSDATVHVYFEGIKYFLSKSIVSFAKIVYRSFLFLPFRIKIVFRLKSISFNFKFAASEIRNPAE